MKSILEMNQGEKAIYLREKAKRRVEIKFINTLRLKQIK